MTGLPATTRTGRDAAIVWTIQIAGGQDKRRMNPSEISSLYKAAFVSSRANDDSMDK